jgi:hypothetical protein
MSPLESLSSACLPSSVMLTLAKGQCERFKSSKKQKNQPFLVYHVLQPLLNLKRVKRRKPEAGASTLYGRDDLVHIVADDAEPNIPRILFDDWYQNQREGSKTHQLAKRSYCVEVRSGQHLSSCRPRQG